MVAPGKLGQVSLAHIRDGASNTFLIGEYATFKQSDHRASGITFWASTHSFHNEGSPQPEMASRIPDFDECMRIVGNKHWRCDRAFASLHSGHSINFVMCDGSVHTIGQTIDGGLFEDMATIAGGEVAVLP